MSADPGPSPPQPTAVPRPAGLARYVKRLSTAFKRPGRTAPSSSPPSAPAQQATIDAAAPALPADNITPAAPIAPPLPPATISPPAAAPAAAAASSSPPTTRLLDRNAMQQERARALFAKYGLTVESHEWITTTAPGPFPKVQRIERPVRMRVHRGCHRCGTLYGADRVCFNCEHKRCKKCPRYPQKRTPEERLKDGEIEVAEKPRRKRVLTITTKSGNELAHQLPKQRIRRICHKCDSLFIPPTATVCEQCQHVRCTKCPREPAKPAKWPKGYPGDAEALSDSEIENQMEKFRKTWRKPRARIRWECEQCHNVFLNGSSECPGCGHERCSKCTRTPAKKVKKEEQFDPLTVAAVEAKLRALAVSDDTTTSGAEAT